MKKWVKYCIAAGVGLVVATILIFARGIIEAEDLNTATKIFCDAFFVPGAILCCVGLLVVISNGGFFDIFGYGFILFISVFQKDVKKRKYKDYVEYKKVKNENRPNLYFVLIVGTVFIAISVVFLIIYCNT